MPFLTLLQIHVTVRSRCMTSNPLPPPPNYSHHNVIPLLQRPDTVSKHLSDLEQATLELQARRRGEHHLATPLELEQVLQVPGHERMAQLKGHVAV